MHANYIFFEEVIGFDALPIDAQIIPKTLYWPDEKTFKTKCPLPKITEAFQKMICSNKKM